LFLADMLGIPGHELVQADLHNGLVVYQVMGLRSSW